jgi:hypothetical protein
MASLGSRDSSHSSTRQDRTYTLTLALTPFLDVNGDVDFDSIEVGSKSTLPSRSTMSVRVKVKIKVPKTRAHGA